MFYKLALTLAVIGLSQAAFAVPRNMYLASPTKIEVVKKQVKLTFELPCTNEYPNEWAGNLISVSDDEGDLVQGLGVVLSKESCEPGPLKNYVFTYSLKEAGLSLEDLKAGASFAPIDLAN